MSPAITTSLLMLEYTGTPNLVAHVIGANPTATTFCWFTKETIILGRGLTRHLRPGAVTTGIWREGSVDEDEEEGYSFSMECQMDYTMPKVTATYTKHGGTTFDGFFYFGYGYFDWTPVTVTAGQSYLLSSKTAASTEATATSDVSGTANAAKATTSAGETTSTIDDGVITVTGEASSTTTSSNGAGTRRALSLWAAVGLAATVVLL
ncbi:hypothetical protein QL093DRAFT_2452767 [Fusarium oxysporum]|nr:hypothetical protein QL093DRAFT_2452767 [Fusarium oxysporum]